MITYLLVVVFSIGVNPSHTVVVQLHSQEACEAALVRLDNVLTPAEVTFTGSCFVMPTRERGL